MPGDYSFRKEDRLRKRSEFKQVESQRCRAYGQFVVAYVAHNELEKSRLGVTVTKKIGNSPTRNWWKRRLREVFRLSRGSFATPVDLVLIVRFEAAGKRPPYKEIERDILQSVEKAIKKLPTNSSKEAPTS